MRLLDIGAHYGFFALAALHAGGPTAEVICIEPSSNAVEVLRANLEANHATSRVRIINVALGEADGRLQMLTTGPLSADYLVVPSEARPDTIPVPARSMQSVLHQTNFRPTHVKIDIEGYELEVIQSSLSLLENIKPVIYLELHGDYIRARGKDPASVIANLRDIGYRYFMCGRENVTYSRLETEYRFNCRLVCRT